MPSHTHTRAHTHTHTHTHTYTYTCRLLITDDKGTTCSREDVNSHSGCCNSGVQHSCDKYVHSHTHSFCSKFEAATDLAHQHKRVYLMHNLSCSFMLLFRNARSIPPFPKLEMDVCNWLAGAPWQTSAAQSMRAVCPAAWLLSIRQTRSASPP